MKILGVVQVILVDPPTFLIAPLVYLLKAATLLKKHLVAPQHLKGNALQNIT